MQGKRILLGFGLVGLEKIEVEVVVGDGYAQDEAYSAHVCNNYNTLS